MICPPSRLYLRTLLEDKEGFRRNMTSLIPRTVFGTALKNFFVHLLWKPLNPIPENAPYIWRASFQKSDYLDMVLTMHCRPGSPAPCFIGPNMTSGTFVFLVND